LNVGSRPDGSPRNKVLIYERRHDDQINGKQEWIPKASYGIFCYNFKQFSIALLTPLILGSRSFPNNLVQGPLAGISCAPFRRLTWELSKPAFTYTEMISCKTLLYQVKSNERFIKKYPSEGPVCYQLSGNDPIELAKATQLVTEAGADLIDLNCGCPVNKIRSRGAGSSLLKNPTHLYKLIQAMKQNTQVPVSVKIRIDGHSNERFNHDLVLMLKDSGVDFITVHGRHWSEGYDVPCHYQQIQYFVEELRIPVIGNGDIHCIESLKSMFTTGCAGGMIGRAGVGQPWLIAKLKADLVNELFVSPSPIEIGKMFLTHVQELSELLGNEKFAVIQARKFAKYYARHLKNPREFSQTINICENLQQLTLACAHYFDQ
jgi:tRNA-dihydrouridine synthase B